MTTKGLHGVMDPRELPLSQHTNRSGHNNTLDIKNNLSTVPEMFECFPSPREFKLVLRSKTLFWRRHCYFCLWWSYRGLSLGDLTSLLVNGLWVCNLTRSVDRRVIVTFFILEVGVGNYLIIICPWILLIIHIEQLSYWLTIYFVPRNTISVTLHVSAPWLTFLQSCHLLIIVSLSSLFMKPEHISVQPLVSGSYHPHHY